MKKILIIIGIVVATGFLLVVVGIFALITMIHRAQRLAGPAIYSGIGEWTRMDEFAHAQGKTNYIAAADDQLTLLREAQKEWQESADIQNVSVLQKVQSDAYTTMDQKIKNGLNPFAYLDNTNFGAPPPPVKGEQ